MHLSNFSGYQVDIKDTHILLILLDVNKLPIIKGAPFDTPGFTLASVYCQCAMSLGHSQELKIVSQRSFNLQHSYSG